MLKKRRNSNEISQEFVKRNSPETSEEIQGTAARKRRYGNIVIATVAFLLISVGTGVTMAYFMDTIRSDNYIQFGSVKLDLIQTTLDENGVEQAFDSSIECDVTNDAAQSRIIRVKNVGNHSLFIRVQMNLNCISENGESFVGNDYVKYVLNLEDWIFQDGWYYYKLPVEPNGYTTELMTEVIFDVNTLVDIYPDSHFEMDFYAQGVQSEHNDVDVLKVAGWPEE